MVRLFLIIFSFSPSMKSLMHFGEVLFNPPTLTSEVRVRVKIQKIPNRVIGD